MILPEVPYARTCTTCILMQKTQGKTFRVGASAMGDGR